MKKNNGHVLIFSLFFLLILTLWGISIPVFIKKELRVAEDSTRTLNAYANTISGISYTKKFIENNLTNADAISQIYLPRYYGSTTATTTRDLDSQSTVTSYVCTTGHYCYENVVNGQRQVFDIDFTEPVKRRRIETGYQVGNDRWVGFNMDTAKVSGIVFDTNGNELSRRIYKIELISTREASAISGRDSNNMGEIYAIYEVAR